MNYNGRCVLIVGLGISGQAAARYMHTRGAEIILADTKTKSELSSALSNLADLNLFTELGPHNVATFLASDLIVASPGIDIRKSPYKEAVEKGVELVNEPELAFREIKVPTVAITGTNGKTTTTTLIGEILSASSKAIFVGGNIGRPLVQFAKEQSAPELVVAELSSYQLELIKSLVPAVAVVTNISQNHLDRYESLEDYAKAKRHLLELCDTQSVVVLNKDDAWAEFLKSASRSKNVFYFSTRGPVELGCFFDRTKNQIVARGMLKGEDLEFSLAEFKLPGEHNIENLMAAIAASLPMGASPTAVEKVIRTFKGVAHRIEFVRTHNEVTYYNDSKSTTVGSLITCLKSFRDGTNIALVGGRDKGSDYRPLTPYLEAKCRAVVLFGEARELIKGQISNIKIPVSLAPELEGAVKTATSYAKSGDSVILSPACASQDQYRNFEHRGDHFKQIVQSLV